MKIVKIFYDLETTGLDVKKHSIHQIAGLIEVDEEVVEEFNIHTRPHPKAIIDPQAIAISGVTEEQILAYPDMKDCHHEFVTMLGKYINRYNKKDKAYLVGYNNRSFDDLFLRAWFSQNKDEFFGSYFYSDSRDVLVLASEYLENRRPSMSNFQQQTVASTLGIVVDPEKLHDATYDVELTRRIYRIVTNRDIEL